MQMTRFLMMILSTMALINVSMANPFNVDYELNDIDVELDDE